MHVPNNLVTRPKSSYTVLLICTLIPLYFVSFKYRLTHPYGGTFSRPPPKDFIQDWLDVQVITPFNPSAIAGHCNRSTWNPDLVFNLDNANGGIGNVRGNILDFVLIAIETGASIILPGMASRSTTDISNVWAARAPFDLMFDEDWFVTALEQACPQMIVYGAPKDGLPTDVIPGNYLPHSRRMDVSFDNSRAALLTHFAGWLNEKNVTLIPGTRTVVSLERTLWDIDTRSLPRGVRRNIGQLLRLNPKVLKLAAAVVQNLATSFHLPIDPRDTFPSKAFYGAHLRTEQDAKNAGWLNEPNTNFSAQTDAYIAHALTHNLRVIYVATGNETEYTRFQTKAAAHHPPLNVTSKYTVLPPHLLAEMAKLTWDQQALVDYAVLLRSSVFGGFVKSSFSYNIALTRHQWVEDWGRVSEPERVRHREPGVCFDDGFSRVLGRDGWHEMRIPRGMWP